MATWVTHFRIAEQLIQKEQLSVSKIEFLVGNIGPDCGLIGKDGKPTPPKEITHFKRGRDIDAELFFDQYLFKPNDIEHEKFSYYLGYYIHLVTDQLWSTFYKQKKEDKAHQSIINEPNYYNILKKDWYGLDFLYLAQHPNHIFWTEFQHITEFPEYLEIFPQGQTLQQIKNITKFYQKRKPYADHPFHYLNPEEADQFVDDTVETAFKLITGHVGG